MVTFREMKVQEIVDDEALTAEQKIEKLRNIESEARALQRAASESAMASRRRTTGASPVLSATRRRTRNRREGLSLAYLCGEFPGRLFCLCLAPPEPRLADGGSSPVIELHVVAAVLAGKPDLADDAGIELVQDETGHPMIRLIGDGATADRAVAAARDRGVLWLAGGPEGRVAQIIPPLTIAARQLAAALDRLEEALAAYDEALALTSTVSPV